MKQSHAIAYLRQLCCSGLGSDIVIPEFLRALHQVIPSGRNMFCKVDEHFNYIYQTPDYYIPEFESLTETAIPAMATTFTPENVALMAAWHRQHPLMSDPRHIHPDYYQMDFYNLICRPLEQHHFLEVGIRQHANIVGTLSLMRPRTAKPFNEAEQRLAVQVAPYVAHALLAPTDTAMEYAASTQSGMLVMDQDGAIEYWSDTAQQLLLLARFPTINLNGKTLVDPLHAQLQQLCRNLQAIFQDKAAPPPNWSHTNANGRFLFRAHWLHKHNQQPGGMAVISIEHQEPQALKILRALQNLPLSPVQKEVAALLAQGVSSEAICQRLHIKPYTLKDHVRKIFVKLDIHSREELLPKMLAMVGADGRLAGVFGAWRGIVH